MKTPKYYGWLDRFRLVAALLVIAIHTSPLTVFSEDADFFFTRVLARVAVPFFFMLTGHFTLGSLFFSDPAVTPCPPPLSQRKPPARSEAGSRCVMRSGVKACLPVHAEAGPCKAVPALRPVHPALSAPGDLCRTLQKAYIGGGAENAAV